MNIIWRVSGETLDAESFVRRHRLDPFARHGPSSFNVMVAEDVDEASLDAQIEAFLAERGGSLSELASTGGTSELNIAFFIESGDEFSSAAFLSPAALQALGRAGVGLVTTVYVCEAE